MNYYKTEPNNYVTLSKNVKKKYKKTNAKVLDTITLKDKL